MEMDQELLSWPQLIGLIASLASFLIVSAYFYFQHVFSYWEKRGIKGPKPAPFVGNFLQIMQRDEMRREWASKYGKVYGIYMGIKPRLVIADPELFVQICIKDFDLFTNHESMEFANKYQDNFVFTLKDDHWKKVRALMSPTFTSGKMKKMFKLLDDCADDLVQCLTEQLPAKDTQNRMEAEVNLKDIYSLYTMDGIASCCYGIKLQRAGSSNLKTAATRDEFVQVAMKLFDLGYSRFLIAMSLPKKLLQFFNFELFPTSNLKELDIRVRSLIKGRQTSSQKYNDLLQLLIDARLDDKMELGEMDLEENHHANLSQDSLIEDQKRMTEYMKLKSGASMSLTEMEIVTNAAFLLAVGLETTGTLLSIVSYCLAFHQNIQQKLHQELLAICEFNEDKTKFSFSYEAVTSCRYLDAVLSEALRYLCPVLQSDRSASREYNIDKYNLNLEKNMVVNLAFDTVHHDPDYWQNPYIFDPERFMPGNKEKIAPGSYSPFGLGPRHCLGMRFALTEAKLALAKVIMNFEFRRAAGTSFPPEPNVKWNLNNIRNPLVMIAPRR